MMRKIQDLELQNAKLKKHAEEAEGAIRNYRGFLSSRTSSGSDGGSDKIVKPGISVQTDITGSVVGALQANERLADAKREIAKLERLQQIKKTSEKQKETASGPSTATSIVASKKPKEEEKLVANLNVLEIAPQHVQDSKVSAMEAQIKTHKAEISHLKNTMKLHQNTQEDHVSQAMRVESDFMLVKKTYEEEKSDIQRDLDRMKAFLTCEVPAQMQVGDSYLYILYRYIGIYIWIS